ncbi:ABC transporter ATP-binding protein [Methylonatrum kenyense]|uniref:ABC transporter ATP-binding protein n=1 Tax=Methylonatrum kenyense TaxID=455253 RepID=UPI0020C13BBC|nr:ABC transporter ATP-binding protein [Methylonatrum kenyense]MCK8517012.1 ABC transporter ATP-binding protein [Methylonatrum kenyense]
MTDRMVLRADDLGMCFHGPEGEIRLFRNLALNITAGETVAILGASGSGKSTLLGLLAGLDTPSEGRILIGDTDITALDEDQRAILRGRELGFVFQAFHLLSGLTALENVMLPLELAGTSGASETATRALADVGLAERRGHYPRQLSGGEQQRVAIARAFVTGPRLLLADEPTGNLDQTTGGRVSDLLFSRNREAGTTLVLVTHDPLLARRCDRVLQLSDGRLEAA